MKYVLMCGGDYKDRFTKPKQLLEVNGEVLVERTIRLLKENGIDDIAISTNNPMFDYLEFPKLKSKIEYIHDNPERHKKSMYSWLNAYYPIKEPCCYIHGDVYFSEKAIKTIVNTEVKDTMFFCTRDLQDGRKQGINSKGREPLAYKVQNQQLFRQAINDLFKMIDEGKFKKDPISWNVYRQINHLPIDFNGFGSDIFKSKGDYVFIDDYTTDVDNMRDIERIETIIKIMRGEIKMVKVQVIEEFTLGRFNELRNIVRAGKEENGRLFKGDTFECTEEMVEYLTGDNHLKRAFVKVIEVIPEKKIEEKKTTAKKRTTKKSTKKEE